MAGIKSINRNLRTEDDEVRKDIQAWQREMFEEGGYDQPAQGDGEDMEIMSAGNVTFNRHYHYPSADTPEQPPASPAQQSPPSLLRKAAPYVLAAALGGSVPGAGLLWLANQKPSEQPAASSIDTVNEYKVGFGTPEPRAK